MTSRFTLPSYLTGTAASLFGNTVIAVVLPWLVLERTGDPAAAGLVAALSALPGLPAAFFGGYLIDRVGRKRMAVFSDIGSALAVAGLAIVDSLVGLNTAWFIALGVLGAIFDVPGMTARETLLADVASASGTSLERIGALRGALFGLCILAGPALAGWLLTVIPVIPLVWVTATCSAIAALVTALMPLPQANPATGQDDSLLAGLRYSRRTPGLLHLLLFAFGVAAVSAPLISVILPAHFNASHQPSLLGLALSTNAVGDLVGSALYGTLFVGRPRAAWITAQVLLLGGMISIATLAGFWTIAAGLAAFGIASGLVGPLLSVTVTRRTPDQMRGRVLALFSAASTLASPIGLGVVTALLGFGPLALGTWALAFGLSAVTVWAVLSPRLSDYLVPQEETDADYQTAS